MATARASQNSSERARDVGCISVFLCSGKRSPRRLVPQLRRAQLAAPVLLGADARFETALAVGSVELE